MAKKRKNSNYKPKATVQAPIQENRRGGSTKLSTRAKILLPISAVLLIGAYILSSKAASGEGTMAIVSYANLIYTFFSAVAINSPLLHLV